MLKKLDKFLGISSAPSEKEVLEVLRDNTWKTRRGITECIALKRGGPKAQKTTDLDSSFFASRMQVFDRTLHLILKVLEYEGIIESKSSLELSPDELEATNDQNISGRMVMIKYLDITDPSPPEVHRLIHGDKKVA